MDKFVNAKTLEYIMRALSNIGYEKIERTIREKYGDFLTNEQIRFVKAYKIRNDNKCFILNTSISAQGR